MSQNWTPPPPPAGGSATVPNYLVPAIISIFCCWPLAIPAIIFAVQVNNKVTAGDIAGAQDASKKAKMFSFIAIGLGLVGILIYVVMLVLGVGLSAIGNR
jgi:Interferon-induced transmembrane protein